MHSISSNNSTQVDEIYQKKIENLEREVKELKEYIKNNKSIISDDKTEKKSNTKVNVTAKSNLEEEVKEENLTEFPNTEELKKAVIDKGKIRLYSALAGAKIYIDDVVRIITTNSFGYKLLTLDENAEVMAQILYEKYNVNKNILLELKNEKGDSISKIEKVLKDNNIEYTNLD